MSLYNMVHGEEQVSKVLLRMIKMYDFDIPRYRDCYLNEHEYWDGAKELLIVIHTRTGGGNREEYESGNFMMTLNQYYRFDRDDDFDSTYANFYYGIPEEYKEVCRESHDKNPTLPPAEKWKLLLETLKRTK